MVTGRCVDSALTLGPLIHQVSETASHTHTHTLDPQLLHDYSTVHFVNEIPFPSAFPNTHTLLHMLCIICMHILLEYIVEYYSVYMYTICTCSFSGVRRTLTCWQQEGEYTYVRTMCAGT